MVVFFIALRWINLSTPLTMLLLSVLLLLLLPTLRFVPIWTVWTLLRFLQVMLLRLRLRILERLVEVAPQRDIAREARLERLRRKVERVRRVLVADRLRLLRREGEQVAAVACCQRRVQAREDRVVLELALRDVGSGVGLRRRDRRVDAGQLLREPRPAG